MIITPLEIAVLPYRVGVSGETPRAAVTIWVSTIVFPQIPAQIKSTVMLHKTESKYRNILTKECTMYIYYVQINRFIGFTHGQISYYQQAHLWL